MAFKQPQNSHKNKRKLGSFLFGWVWGFVDVFCLVGLFVFMFRLGRVAVLWLDFLYVDRF